MKKLVIIILATLLLLAPLASCQQQPQAATPSSYGEADEEGSIHPMIPVPEDIVPGDYEVEIFTGRNVFDRELIATLPIRIQAIKG